MIGPISFTIAYVGTGQDQNTCFWSAGDSKVWIRQQETASKLGARLLTLSEAKAMLKFQRNKCLFPDCDQWAAVINNGERDWVYVGNLSFKPGSSYRELYGKYPDWGDDEGPHRAFNRVVLMSKSPE